MQAASSTFPAIAPINMAHQSSTHHGSLIQYSSYRESFFQMLSQHDNHQGLGDEQSSNHDRFSKKNLSCSVPKCSSSSLSKLLTVKIASDSSHQGTSSVSRQNSILLHQQASQRLPSSEPASHEDISALNNATAASNMLRFACPRPCRENSTTSKKIGPYHTPPPYQCKLGKGLSYFLNDATARSSGRKRTSISSMSEHDSEDDEDYDYRDECDDFEDDNEFDEPSDDDMDDQVAGILLADDN